MKTRIIATLAAAAALAGCAGMTQVVEERQKLYGPPALNTASPAVSAYRQAARAAADSYSTATPAQPIVAMVDAGIAAANSNCRAWFGRVSTADLRWEQGEGNLAVAENAVTAILGAAGAAPSIVAGYGIAATALSGYNGNFRASVLGVADHDLQAKVLEMMAARAGALRAEAPGLTYPQAIDALEGYAALCTPQAARAAAKSALTATVTTASPAGSIQSTGK